MANLLSTNTALLLGFLIMVFGSLVDLYQFGFMMRRYFRKRNKRIYDEIRRQVIVDEHDKRVKK